MNEQFFNTRIFISFLSSSLSDSTIADRKQRSVFPGVYGIEQYNSRSKAESNCQILYEPRKLNGFQFYPKTQRFSGNIHSYSKPISSRCVNSEQISTTGGSKLSFPFYLSGEDTNKFSEEADEQAGSSIIKASKLQQSQRQQNQCQSKRSSRNWREHIFNQINRLGYVEFKNCRIYRKLGSSYPHSAHIN